MKISLFKLVNTLLSSGCMLRDRLAKLSGTSLVVNDWSTMD